MVKEFLSSVYSFIRATVRLILLALLFVLEGLHQIIFDRREISGFDFIFTYTAIDKDKIAYLDKLDETVFGLQEDNQESNQHYDDEE